MDFHPLLPRTGNCVRERDGVDVVSLVGGTDNACV